ncbi:uncharacterized protein SPPG_03732 [Spizellomyces punctatus DAOM BR117]|uniref:Uncharacterized protein n=1 Tax=Spizellomyces punctatus (strain DAOM BR117) TaxID=645134 RepID=A0A0L0HIB3_SPIPD|nr:uncharacterized protein SPPG_03732 [Spizellomyces punctatus DAOM BR117]KND00605.1 hypothetical protein SPPG_03732 [Spizellomyces punctatus DAOM BR117]|eukprot:XP_016608644.1 hypothetical protein SPPG_03732 [Spizellomyces punctatus DAOM BR117]
MTTTAPYNTPFMSQHGCKRRLDDAEHAFYSPVKRFCDGMRRVSQQPVRSESLPRKRAREEDDHDEEIVNLDFLSPVFKRAKGLDGPDERCLSMALVPYSPPPPPPPPTSSSDSMTTAVPTAAAADGATATSPMDGIPLLNSVQWDQGTFQVHEGLEGRLRQIWGWDDVSGWNVGGGNGAGQVVLYTGGKWVPPCTERESGVVDSDKEEDEQDQAVLMDVDT